MKDVRTFSLEVSDSDLADTIKDLEAQDLKQTTKLIGIQIDKGEFRVTPTPSELHPNQRKLSDTGEPLWSIDVRKK
jgi:hypothetical protein